MVAYQGCSLCRSGAQGHIGPGDPARRRPTRPRRLTLRGAAAMGAPARYRRRHGAKTQGRTEGAGIRPWGHDLTPFQLDLPYDPSGLYTRARGNALGSGYRFSPAPKGRDIVARTLCRALSGLDRLIDPIPGRCPGLVCPAPSGLPVTGGLPQKSRRERAPHRPPPLGKTPGEGTARACATFIVRGDAGTTVLAGIA